MLDDEYHLVTEGCCVANDDPVLLGVDVTLAVYDAVCVAVKVTVPLTVPEPLFVMEDDAVDEKVPD